MFDLAVTIQQSKVSVKDAVISWAADSVALLSGDSRAFTLSHSWMVRHYLMEKRVRIIDCAVRFDNISLVDELLRLNLDVDTAINEMDIRRAFTPYQILAAVDEIPEGKGKTEAVYYLLAPYKQFFDGDVAADEAAYLLHELNKRLMRLSEKGQAVLVVEKNNYNHPAFAQAFYRLRDLAKPSWQIVDVQQPAGTVSVLRSMIGGLQNGTHHRTIQQPNGARRATTIEVPQRLAQL